jgi:hypothetical protein
VSATATDGKAESFFDGALRRITRNILFVAVIGFPVAAWRWGMAGLVGFVAGAFLSYVNFLWLSRGVEAIAERITEQGSREKGGSAVVKAILRYALVGVAGYAIFKSSSYAFYAFFAGLCLPVVAMLCEAAFELFISLRKGF